MPTKLLVALGLAWFLVGMASASIIIYASQRHEPVSTSAQGAIVLNKSPVLEVNSGTISSRLFTLVSVEGYVLKYKDTYDKIHLYCADYGDSTITGNLESNSSISARQKCLHRYKTPREAVLALIKDFK